MTIFSFLFLQNLFAQRAIFASKQFCSDNFSLSKLKLSSNYINSNLNQEQDKLEIKMPSQLYTMNKTQDVRREIAALKQELREARHEQDALLRERSKA